MKRKRGAPFDVLKNGPKTQNVCGMGRKEAMPIFMGFGTVGIFSSMNSSAPNGVKIFAI